MLLREAVAINPETGLEEGKPLSPEKIAEIEKLVSGAIGINADRGDTLTVSSSPFISTLEGVSKEWHEKMRMYMFTNLDFNACTYVSTYISFPSFKKETKIKISK